MRHLNIEIGSRELRTYVATLSYGHIDHKCVKRDRINTLYSQGRLMLDTERLCADILSALAEAGEVDRISVTGPCDAVCVLGEDDMPILPCLSTRDEGLDRVSDDAVPAARIQEDAGVDVDRRGALYRLAALKTEDGELFERATTFLFLPDYVRFRLTGVKATDRSLAQAAGIIKDGQVNEAVFEDMGIRNLFPALGAEDSLLGPLTDETAKAAGHAAPVFMNAADPLTLALSVFPNATFITNYQGGMIGRCTESVVKDERLLPGLVNGQGYVSMPFAGYSLIQDVKKGMPDGTTFDSIEAQAREGHVFEYVDIRDSRLAGGKVIEGLNAILTEEGREKVEGSASIGLLYNSIARYASAVITLLDTVMGVDEDPVLLIGHGARDSYLDSLMAMWSHRSLVASEGCFASLAASLHTMIVEGGIHYEEAYEMMRSTYGVTSFSRQA